MDFTDIDFVTLDPLTATDLDQAFHISQASEGAFRLRYAIADVPGFVTAGGPLDIETRRRGQTIYCPDAKVSLHPPLLADDAASLLPGQLRNALVWTIDVADDGSASFVELRRGVIRSRAKLDYESAQRDLDQGSGHEQVKALREVGHRRMAAEVARGAVSLPRPAQEIGQTPNGFALRYRTPEPVEQWNAQLSLLTGMAAAELMVAGGIGILRTMPPPSDGDLAAVRSAARGLGIPWPPGMAYPELIRALDPSQPAHAAFLDNVTILMRGAGYDAFQGAPPAVSSHSAIAGLYAHVTAPLRRLVDRFGLQVCLALAAGRPVPEHVQAALPELPGRMAATTRAARAVERDCVDYLESEMLAGRQGVPFRGVVIEQRRDDGIVQIADPAIVARVRGRDLPVGQWVDAWLAQCDPETGRVVFEVLSRAARGGAGQAARGGS